MKSKKPYRQNSLHTEKNLRVNAINTLQVRILSVAMTADNMRTQISIHHIVYSQIFFSAVTTLTKNGKN